MKNIITVLLMAVVAVTGLHAQATFENEYFKINLPEGMEKYELPASVKDNPQNIHRYRNGTNRFMIRIMESELSAAQYVYEMEKTFKAMGELTQSRYFNVNGYVMPGLVEVEKDGDATIGHVHILFDNGRHKLKEAGNALLFQFEMIYRIEDEMQQQPKNEKALQSLRLKDSTFVVSFDYNRTKEFSITAPAASFQYFISYTPVLVTPAQTLLFSDIKQGAYGTDNNPPFADLLKTEFKSFKNLNPKNAVMEEMTINGFKAAMFKGTTEDKKAKYCRTAYRYLIEVSPKLVRTISYELNCEYADIEQPLLAPIVKSFVEHKYKK